MITIEINSDLKDIRDIQLPIKEITGIIKKDIQSILDGQKELTQPYEGDYTDAKALSEKYRKWKSKKLGYTDIYKGKNLKLIKSLKSRATTKEGNIYITLDYAKHVDEKRNFFGISKEALQEIENLLTKIDIG